MIAGYMLINFTMQVQWLCVYHCKSRNKQKNKAKNDSAIEQDSADKLNKQRSDIDMLDGGNPELEEVQDISNNINANNFNSNNHLQGRDGSTDSNAEKDSEFQNSDKYQARLKMKKQNDPLMNAQDRMKTSFPESKKVAPSVCEVLISAIFQPLIMYTGFSRLTIVKSRKAKLIYAA